MTLACEQCNRSGKRTYYDPDLPLINPYSDDPEQHFIDMGSLIMPIAGDDRAYVTKEVLKLNRGGLVERRQERIMSVEKLLNSWVKEKQPTIKKILEEELHNEYLADKEYSSTIKAYLVGVGFPVKDNQQS